MWSQVQTDLERLLAAKIYPLLLGDAVYRHFLMFAGLGANSLDAGPAPAALRPNFEVVAKLRAHIIVSEVEKLGGLDESCTCAKLLKGPASSAAFGIPLSPNDAREYGGLIAALSRPANSTPAARWPIARIGCGGIWQFRSTGAA